MRQETLRHAALGLSFAAAVLVAACTPSLESAEASDTLYSRLGGQPAIEAVVAQTISNVAADQRINGYFAGVDIPALNDRLVNQMCEATGGPCVYTGPDMATAHAGLNITDADFDAFVEDLVAAMNGLGVAQEEQSELLALLGGMKDDVVGA